ncbi:MAG: hypothetical protein ACI9F9_002113 [Candidatus Paceibacteria bacterium]|jgi:hypothetical protein
MPRIGVAILSERAIKTLNLEASRLLRIPDESFGSAVRLSARLKKPCLSDYEAAIDAAASRKDSAFNCTIGKSGEEIRAGFLLLPLRNARSPSFSQVATQPLRPASALSLCPAADSFRSPSTPAQLQSCIRDLLG